MCSQNTVVIAAYDESSVPLASLPLTFSTVDTKALFGVGISGSGTEAETILLTKTKKEVLRERAVEIYNLVQGVARLEVKEPEVPSGAFAYFCHC